MKCLFRTVQFLNGKETLNGRTYTDNCYVKKRLVRLLMSVWFPMKLVMLDLLWLKLLARQCVMPFATFLLSNLKQE